ncbi:MAG: sigma-70 family RNA polymerase sigma factor [Holophagales bacterium]|nr:sigma-70 family RNA polymerase sigma factor [Holophagales bacterium]
MTTRAADSAGEVTRLLRSWHEGDDEALEQLVPLVYDELRCLADRHLRGESQALTLQPTALVHEAYLRLVDLRLEWRGRVHFFAVAAGIMRRILVDLARVRQRQKRGGGQRPRSLTELDLAEPAGWGRPDLTVLDEALEQLEARDARKARAVELRYFAGLTNDEIAEVLDISRPTVERDLRMAKAWLSSHLLPEKEPAHS